MNIYDLFVYPNPTKTNVPTYQTNALNSIYENYSNLIALNSSNETVTLTKSDFVSSGVDYTEENNVTINGKTYIVLDGYNSQVFGSDTHTTTFTVKLSGNGYDTNKNYYSITDIELSGGTGESLTITSQHITNVTQVDGGVDVTIQIYANADLNGWKATATVEYNKPTNISLNADSAFIYTDENSFAIDLSQVSITNEEGTDVSRSYLSGAIEDGATLTVGENEYSNVVVLTAGDDKYYFVYSPETSRLTYYFNATYTANGAPSSETVNQQSETTPLSVVTNFPTEFTATRMETPTSESVTFGAEITNHEVSSTTSTVQNIGSGDSSDINVNLGRVEVGANNGDVRNLSLNGEVIGSITGADTSTSFTLTLNKKVERFFAKGSLILNLSIYNTTGNGYQHDNNTTYITSINSATSESSDTVAYTINLNSSNNYSKTLSTWLNRINLGGFYALTSDFGIKSKDAQTLTYTPTEDSSLYSKTESDTSSVSGVTIEKIYTAIASDIKLTTDSSDNAMECDSRLFDGWSVSDDGSLVREYIQFNLNYTLSEVRITNNSGGAMAMDYNNKLEKLEQGTSQTITANGSAISFDLYQTNAQSTTFVDSDIITINYGENFNPDAESEADVSDYYELNLVFAGSNIDWAGSTLTFFTYSAEDKEYDDGTEETITETIKNAIVTVSQGDLNYIFIKSDQFPNLTASKTHKAESETLNLQVTKNIAELVYSEFTITGENGRNIDNINSLVYNVDGNLTVTTPFQNAADYGSYFTDSASIEGNSTLVENSNSVEGVEAIILTDDAFVTDYITTPTIQANGHALVVAHNASDGQAEMFESYSNVSDAYVAGTANGASISGSTDGINISTLSNNKFFGTVIKSGENDVPENTSSYQDQDFIGFEGVRFYRI